MLSPSNSNLPASASPPSSPEDSAPTPAATPVRARKIRLLLSRPTLTFCDPGSLLPKQSKCEAQTGAQGSCLQALPGLWRGTALFAVNSELPQLDGGCTYCELAAEGDEKIVQTQRTHLPVDCGLAFLGDGAAFQELVRGKSWREVLEKHIWPSLRMFKSAEEVNAKLNFASRATDAVSDVGKAEDPALRKLQEIHQDLMRMRALQIERPMGELPGCGLLLRPEVGDGNYPVTLGLNANSQIVKITIDFWPMVSEM